MFIGLSSRNWGQIVIEPNCPKGELFEGRIALGANCRGRFLLGAKCPATDLEKFGQLIYLVTKPTRVTAAN